MKKLILILFVIYMTAGCNKPANISIKKASAPDISDLTMSEEMQQVFAERRQNLTANIGNGIVVLRSDFGYDGGRHEFRAADNFYYLTGFTMPVSALVLSSDSLNPFTLYVMGKGIRQKIYTGESPETDSIMNTFQADTVLPLQELDKAIERSIRSGTPVYTDLNDPMLKDWLLKTANKIKASDKMVKDVIPIINEIRVHKDDLEKTRIQKAVDITGEAFINACRICRPYMYEFEIEAMIEYTFRKNGSSMPAFECIVGSGPNAVTLHYSANNRKMTNGDLLLMDIGAEYGYYCADVTRTIPVNGKFTEEQKEIYELVLKAQQAAINEMLPGKYLVAGQNKSNEIITQGLYELGLITDPGCAWQKKFYLLYPINHYLGMNVHDVGDYGAPDSTFYGNITADTTYGRILEKGMVLTVEPGLYFRSNGLSQLTELYGREAAPEEIRNFIEKVAPVYEKYKNIGIRIEDDVWITDNGNIVLSKNIPKEIDEIERLIGK